MIKPEIASIKLTSFKADVYEPSDVRCGPDAAHVDTRPLLKRTCRCRIALRWWTH